MIHLTLYIQHTLFHLILHRTLRDLLLGFLASILGANRSRLSLELTQTEPDSQNRFTTEAIIGRAENPTSMSAFEMAAQFLVLWTMSSFSTQATGLLDASVLELDGQVEPRLRYVNVAPPLKNGAALPAQSERLPPITQGIDVGGQPGIAPAVPIDVSGPQPGRQEGIKARAATLLEKEEVNDTSALNALSRATLLGMGAAFVLACTLAIMGVYDLRRRGRARAPTRSVLRVQDTALET